MVKSLFGANLKEHFTKKQRQAWWQTLPIEQQIAFLNKKMAQKTKRRLNEAKEQAVILVNEKEYQDKTCLNCFHAKTESCDGLGDSLVCRSWAE